MLYEAVIWDCVKSKPENVLIYARTMRDAISMIQDYTDEKKEPLSIKVSITRFFDAVTAVRER